MRCEDGDAEILLGNSFYQFLADRAIPDLEKQAKRLEEERDSIIVEEEDSLKDYYNLIQLYRVRKKDVRDLLFSPRHCLPFLQAGRLVCIECTKSGENSPVISIEDQLTWGVVINFERVTSVSQDDTSAKPEEARYVVDVLTRCVKMSEGDVKIVPLKDPGDPLVVSVPLSQVYRLSSIRVIIGKDVLALEARENTVKTVSEVVCRFGKDGVPLLDPVDDMKIHSYLCKKVSYRVEVVERQFEEHEIAKSPLIEQKLKLLHKKLELTAKIKAIMETIQLKAQS